MLGAFRWRAARTFHRFWQKQDHGALARELLVDAPRPAGRPEVWVETGCGLSTLVLAELAEARGAELSSCDLNAEKIEALRARAGSALRHVRFLVGDSLESLRGLVASHANVDFVLLDSAPSALHTLREFLLLEARFAPGALVLVDNAALPGARLLLSPCRKGKLLVPYLLASPHWEVRAHPRAGDSMVSAVRHAEPRFSDPVYEDPQYVDPWRDRFDRTLEP